MLSATMKRGAIVIIEDLAGDWRRLDERVEGLSNEIEAIARHDAGCDAPFHRRSLASE
jgi:hypothetical protein